MLSADEARSAVCAAIRLQAGRFESTPVHLPPSVTIQFPASSSPSPASTSYLLVSTTPASTSTPSDVRTGTVEDVTAAIRAERAAAMAAGTAVGASIARAAGRPVGTATGAGAGAGAGVATKQGGGKLRLTYWALDTALSAVFKGPNPRLGRPSARTKVTMIIIVLKF